MKKILKKIVPTLILSAMIVLVGGFCDGLIASAQMGTDASKVSQAMDAVQTLSAMQQQDLPAANALMPCCVGAHSATPTTQVNNYNAGVRFTAIDSALAAPDSNSSFENKISQLSDPSPPRPDILSSVLKLE